MSGFLSNVGLCGVGSRQPLYKKGTFPLDTVAIDGGIYALEALRYTAQKYAIQMSDGVNHINIGWVDFYPDYAAMVDAILAGKTGIRKIYDQSGKKRNLVQTDFTKMPSILWGATGAGLPAIHFGGNVTPQYMDCDHPVFQGLFAGGGYIAHTSRVISGGTTGLGVLWSVYGDSFGYRNTTQIRFTADFSTTDLFWTATQVLNSWYTWEFLYNSATPAGGQVYRDGAANGALATSPVGAYKTDSGARLRVGSSASGSAGIEMDLTALIIAKDIP